MLYRQTPIKVFHLSKPIGAPSLQIVLFSDSNNSWKQSVLGWFGLGTRLPTSWQQPW